MAQNAYQAGCHNVPSKQYNLCRSVSYTTSPSAGLEIAVRCVVVNRGGKNPLSVASTCNLAEEVAVVPPIKN